MNRAMRWMALLGCVVSAGCASVSGGNTQKMYVQAQSADGAAVQSAECTLSNDKGTWRVLAPGDTSITRSNKRMEVKCDKAPLPQGIVSVESATRGAMYGNIILGGVVGAMVDHSSGAAYEYPEMIKVVMGRQISMDQPKGATPAATAEASKLARTRQEQAAVQPVPARRAAVPPAEPAVTAPSPLASGYARIDDVDALPYVSDRARDDYRTWLTRPTPRAFAVATTGHWAATWGIRPLDPSHPTDPNERALLICGQRAKASCALYAVNGSVVWKKPVAVSPMAQPQPASPAPPVAAQNNLMQRIDRYEPTRPTP